MSILRATTQLLKTKKSLESQIAVLDEKKMALMAQLDGLDLALKSLGHGEAE